ncbi:MAG: hypothetical protein LBQ54_03705 [Planctomycetaceae bacterium]|nr:hypothetical protein [Planctomycetaceae bacterium]
MSTAGCKKDKFRGKNVRLGFMAEKIRIPDREIRLESPPFPSRRENFDTKRVKQESQRVNDEHQKENW